MRAETIAVRIKDYADSPPGILADAAAQAARVLGNSGIGIVWTLAGRDLAEDPGCRRSPAPGELQLEILSARHAAPTAVANALGYAVVPKDGGPGFQAGVFYERVAREASSTLATTTQVLGHVLAHEIGHLLLGSNAHEPSGIMAASLSPRDLDRAAQGQLGFAASEAERLRAGARLRQALPAGLVDDVAVAALEAPER